MICIFEPMHLSTISATEKRTFYICVHHFIVSVSTTICDTIIVLFHRSNAHNNNDYKNNNDTNDE